MAIQQGIIQFTGKLGDLVMYGIKHKIRVRKKNAKPYVLSEETKKGNKDFGYASMNAGYIRRAFAPMVSAFGSDDVINRLNSCLINILKTIPAEFKGNKNLKDGNTELLRGFELNTKSLDSLLFQMPNITIDQKGFLKIIFKPALSKAWFKTYQREFKASLQLMVFNFDLEQDQYQLFTAAELVVDTNKPNFEGAATGIQTQQLGEKILLVCLGITYGNATSKSGNRKYRAAQIIKAMHLKDGIEVRYVDPIITPTKKAIEIIPDMVWGQIADYT